MCEARFRQEGAVCGARGHNTPSSSGTPRDIASSRDNASTGRSSLRGEETPSSLARYVEAESVFEALASTVEGHHPVRLLRMSWLVRQSNDVLPRRQDLPNEAFLSAGELRAIWLEGGFGGETDRLLPVVAVSSLWDTRAHPDPTGAQLKLIAGALRSESQKFAKPNKSFRGFKEMGVFWDWGSLLQEPRAPAEKAAFNYALHKTMDLWYAHRGTTVFLVTQHPRQRGSQREQGPEESGWMAYERCAAEHIKRVRRSHAKWEPLVDLGSGEAKAAVRRWPMGPDDFDVLVGSRSFAVDADRDEVKRLFRVMSRSSLRWLEELELTSVAEPNAEDARRLGRCLCLCSNLRKVDWECIAVSHEAFDGFCGTLHAGSLPVMERVHLGSSSLGDAGAKVLARLLSAGALPGLKELHLNDRGLRAPGVQALANAASDPTGAQAFSDAPSDPAGAHGGASVRPLARLEKLSFAGSFFSDAGAQALAGALAAGAFPMLRTMDLENCGLVGTGVGALAKAAMEPGGNDSRRPLVLLETLNLRSNAMGDEGAKVLANALAAGALPALRVLDLGSCSLQESSVQALAEAASRDGAGGGRPLQCLEEFRLSFNFAIGGTGAQALAMSLAAGALPSLQVLELSVCSLKSVGVRALAEAASQLSGGGPEHPLEKLQAMCLWNNASGDEGVQALADAATRGGFRSLQTLDLRTNGLSDDSARALAAAASSGAFDALKELDLSHNRLGDGGVVALAEAKQAQGFRSLGSVVIAGNGAVSEAGQRALFDAGIQAHGGPADADQ